MKKIITHPGSAHLDDFLSSCLVIYKIGNIDEIHRREPTNKEINDPSIWKLDVGDAYDPTKNCYDHHQKEMEDCTLSLLLKDWGLWEKSIQVHNWLEIAVINDINGPKHVIKLLKISYTALTSLDSFIERTILGFFRDNDIIKKESPLFSLMREIGQKFFVQIDEYFNTFKDIDDKIESKKIKGVPVMFCFKNVKSSSMLLRVLNDKKREIWPDDSGGIVVYPNNRIPGTIALRKYDNDMRVDFLNISQYDKVIFAHPKGFFISVEPMSDNELEKYIDDSIKS